MKNILINNEKELYTKCTTYLPTDENVVKDLLEVFTSSSSDKCLGYGIAGNQIGYTKRVILVSPTTKKKDIIIMYNPTIINHGRDIVYDVEGCLSYPNKREKIGRYRVIDIQYNTKDWKYVTETIKGFNARIIQHELDHLEGLNCLENRL